MHRGDRRPPRASLARTYRPHKSSALQMQTRSYLGLVQLDYVVVVALRPRRRTLALEVPAAALVAAAQGRRGRGPRSPQTARETTGARQRRS